MKFKTLKSDAIFKNVFFRDKQLLKWLLNKTLENSDYYINDFIIRKCELTKDRIYIKSKTIDILIDDGNILYNIELNSNFNEETIRRNYVYQCAQIVNLVKTKMKYKDSLKPIIQINSNFKSNSNRYIKTYTDLEKETHEKYTFIKEIINIDIDKYMDKWYNLEKNKDYYELYKHFLIIGMNKNDLIELKDDDIMVKKIKEEIIKLNEDENFYQFLTDEEDKQYLCNSYYYKGIDEGIEKGINQGIEQGISKGIEEGIEKGIHQGIEQEKISNAKLMKQENIPYDTIKKITGLDTKIIMTL